VGICVYETKTGKFNNKFTVRLSKLRLPRKIKAKSDDRRCVKQ